MPNSWACRSRPSGLGDPDRPRCTDGHSYPSADQCCVLRPTVVKTVITGLALATVVVTVMVVV